MKQPEEHGRTASMSVRFADIVGVVLGGIAGTLVNSIAVSLVVGAPYMELVTSWGKYVVAIAVAATFIWFYAKTPTTVAAVLSLFTGIIVPSIIAKGVFGAEAGWATVFMLNAIYAVVALFVYRSVHGAMSGANRTHPE